MVYCKSIAGRASKKNTKFSIIVDIPATVLSVWRVRAPCTRRRKLMEDREIIQLFFDRDERAIAESRDKYGKYCDGIAAGILHTR